MATFATVAPLVFSFGFLIVSFLSTVDEDRRLEEGVSSGKGLLHPGVNQLAGVTLGILAMCLFQFLMLLRSQSTRIEELEQKVEVLSKAELPPGTPRVADEPGT